MDKKAIATLRALAIEQIDKAQSGHPGMALGAAPILYTLYAKIMKVYPGFDRWVNRDRFILAAGHGSALLYSLLHLAGYGIMISDLKKFRQYQSLTPGHPEYNITPGVDTTSGPLGQGIPIAVGMAIAEEYLRARFNKPDYQLINHHTYVLCGDGDMQEGVTQEALSLAGHMQLSHLIVIYDSNDIQLDGKVNDTNTENIADKYQAMGWNYFYVSDGDDIKQIEQSLMAAKRSDKPSLIEIKTIIGCGSSLANSHKVHGSPLPKADVEKMRAGLGGDTFTVSGEIYDYFHQHIYKRGKEEYLQWSVIYKSYQKDYPEEFLLFEKIINDDFAIDFQNLLNIGENEVKATRVYGGNLMDRISEIHLGLIGGSADLSSSTKVKGGDGNFSSANRMGRNINFGVREHAMAAISNGLALHGLRPVCSTFFVFSDYMKPAIRMSAIMGLPVIYVFTHDSIAVGEDGPTHQPIEQLSMLRSIPNLIVIRPADGFETHFAWQTALETKDKPTAVILTRQTVPNITFNVAANLTKGAYIFAAEKNKIDGILIASGSELRLVMEAKEILFDRGYDVRVVSIPSVDLFEKQSLQYQETVLPLTVRARVAIEMSEGIHLYRYLGLEGKLININRFGASGPGKQIVSAYGFSPENIVEVYINYFSK